MSLRQQTEQSGAHQKTIDQATITKSRRQHERGADDHTNPQTAAKEARQLDSISYLLAVEGAWCDRDQRKEWDSWLQQCLRDNVATPPSSYSSLSEFLSDLSAMQKSFVEKRAAAKKAHRDQKKALR